jgi:hypothetical protein
MGTTHQKATAEMMRQWKENVPWRGTFLHDPRRNDTAGGEMITDPAVLTLLARKLNAARLMAGLSARALSQKARVGEGQVGDVIHGRKAKITLGVVERLAVALGMTVEQLTRE